VLSPALRVLAWSSSASSASISAVLPFRTCVACAAAAHQLSIGRLVPIHPYWFGRDASEDRVIRRPAEANTPAGQTAHPPTCTHTRCRRDAREDGAIQRPAGANTPAGRAAHPQTCAHTRCRRDASEDGAGGRRPAGANTPPGRAGPHTADVASQEFDFSAENVKRGPPSSLPQFQALQPFGVAWKTST